MPGKFKIIMSDLHLSAGRVAEGNPLEDFGSDEEFAALLDEVVIVNLTIDPDIATDDLHTFVTRLLEMRQEARSARSLSSLSVSTRSVTS